MATGIIFSKKKMWRFCFFKTKCNWRYLLKIKYEIKFGSIIIIMEDLFKKMIFVKFCAIIYHLSIVNYLVFWDFEIPKFQKIMILISFDKLQEKSIRPKVSD